MRHMKFTGIAIGIILIAALALAQEAKKDLPADRFSPIRFLEGNWAGTSESKSGTGRVERTYERIMRDRFLQGRNKTVYDANEKNPNGETHED